jgi:hypothetical protein
MKVIGATERVETRQEVTPVSHGTRAPNTTQTPWKPMRSAAAEREAKEKLGVLESRGCQPPVDP